MRAIEISSLTSADLDSLAGCRIERRGSEILAIFSS